jgi:hypothetical protein
MFVATSKAYLDEVLRARALPHPATSLSHFADELKDVPRDAPVWAVRRFTPQSLAKGQMLDKDIKGCSVYMEKDEKRVVVRSISDNPEGFKICSTNWNAYLKQEDPVLPLEIVKQDARTTRIVLDATTPKGNVPLFLLFAALGHPIFV